MLILTDTNDKLQLVTDAAVTVDVVAAFVDLSGTTVTPGKQVTAITTATTTDIVAAPASSTSRKIKSLYVRNKHASSSVVVTVVLDDNATDYEIHKVTLLAGEMLEYEEGVGFFTLEAADVTNPITVARLGSDFTTSSTTLAEVTGLSTATGTGTFIWEYFIITNSAATTTGQKFSVNYDGTVTSFVADIMWLTAATTASDDVPDQDHVAAPGGVFSGFSARAKSTAGWGATTDVDATGDVFYTIFGMAIVTVAGNFELWYASEAAASSTVKAGSSLRLTKTA